MRLLFLDTCGASGSVALADGARVVAEEVLPGRSASERLVPAVRGLLEEEGWRLAELAAIVVVHGPGSFTGVRIGLSAAKGLSEAVGVPLVAVSRLAVLAGMGVLSTVLPFAKGAKEGALGVLGGVAGVCAALDAGRGEFYLRDGAGLESVATLEELLAVVGGGEVVVCEARVAEALAVVNPPFAESAKDGAPAPGHGGTHVSEARRGAPGSLRVRVVAEPRAADALGIVLERVAAGRFDDAAAVDANYLRRSEGLYGRTVSG